MIKQYLTEVLTDRQKEEMYWSSDVTQRMLQALDSSVIDNTLAIGLPYWAEQDALITREFTRVLCLAKVAKTNIRMNFTNLEFFSHLLDPSEVLAYRTAEKFNRYCLRLDTKTYSNTLVKRNGKVLDNGINRVGMNTASKNEYKIDTDVLRKYLRPIKLNILKSIRKGIEQGHIAQDFFDDRANYKLIVDSCLEYYCNPDNQYNSEYSVQDQRGRAIKNTLKRIGNYITSKDFRAMLIVPSIHAVTIKKTDTDTLNQVYLFIAELTGNKSIGKSIEDKIEAGKNAYLAHSLPRLNLKIDSDRKELHNLIWLERMYLKLDFLFKVGVCKWDIPIEIDHTMSLAQIVGALTNDKRLLESTGVIGETLSDPWLIPGVRRDAGKFYGTPTFYGSSRSAMGLIASRKFLFEQVLLQDKPSATEAELAKAKAKSKVEVASIKKEFSKGKFAVLKQFKDLLIRNYDVKTPVVAINTGVSEFEIHVNKFKTAGNKVVVTEVWDSAKYKFRYSFTHKPVLIPDYDHMKTFWATCLIHHLDSDLLEHNLRKFQDSWVLDIHDAVLCLPTEALAIKLSASARLKFYNTNRMTILGNYLKSIGATTPKAQLQLIRLFKSVVDAGDAEFKTTLMK